MRPFFSKKARFHGYFAKDSLYKNVSIHSLWPCSPMCKAGSARGAPGRPRGAPSKRGALGKGPARPCLRPPLSLRHFCLVYLAVLINTVDASGPDRNLSLRYKTSPNTVCTACCWGPEFGPSFFVIHIRDSYLAKARSCFPGEKSSSLLTEPRFCSITLITSQQLHLIRDRCRYIKIP